MPQKYFTLFWGTPLQTGNAFRKCKVPVKDAKLSMKK